MNDRIIMWGLVACLLLAGCAAPPEPPMEARSAVERALTAMGGHATLAALEGVHLEGIGHTYEIEQSERPEGPWIASYRQVDETVDLARGRIRRTVSQRTVQFPDWSPATYIYDADALGMVLPGRGVRPGLRSQIGVYRDRLRYGPERVLFTALQAADLAGDPPAYLQGVRHDRVHFTEGGDTVRIWLNSHTGLPTAVDIVGTGTAAFDVIWGRTTTRTFYSLWTMEPGGIRYPCQWDVELDGTPRESLTITGLDTSPTLAETDLHLDDATVRAFSEMPTIAFDDVTLGTAFGGRPLDPIEPAAGITIYPGAWNTTIVRQDDRVVVLEAPMTSGYSEQVLDTIAKRYTRVPVTGVVTTSDAWPHLGGLRPYVAESVPVYGHPLNLPIIRRLLEADYRDSPDRLTRSPRSMDFTPVEGPVPVGNGPNRMVLYPIRGEAGERMVMAYFPEHRLLYGSDLLQRLPDGRFWMTQYVWELVQAVRREDLDVDRVYAMHLTPIPWSDVLAALEGPPVGAYVGR